VLDSDEARASGREIFLAKCALCHGERADGNGVRSKGLSTKAANFRSPDWRARVTPEYVFQIVSTGKRGTSMPAWPTLSETEKWNVIAYILSVSENAR
jgi:high-affinity iron transporter